MRDGYRTEDTWILFLAACSLSFLLDLLECRGMCLYISTYILYIHGCLYMLIYVSLPFKSSEMFLEQSNTHLCTYYPDIFFQLQTSEDATETICPIELKIFPTWTFAGKKKIWSLTLGVIFLIWVKDPSFLLTMPSAQKDQMFI